MSLCNKVNGRRAAALTSGFHPNLCVTEHSCVIIDCSCNVLSEPAKSDNVPTMRSTTSTHRALGLSHPSISEQEAKSTRAAPERVMIFAMSLLIAIKVSAFATLRCNCTCEGLLFAAPIKHFEMEED